jgi:type I restriction enzyme S subunit
MNLKVFPEGTVVASCSASLGTYAIAQVPLVTNQTFIGIVCGPELLNKFLLYLLEISTERLVLASNSGTIPYISRKKFEEFIIPVPPLEVQREIVSILDKFTELEAELQAELEARAEQYEHFRAALLSSGKKLGATQVIGDNTSGGAEVLELGQLTEYVRGLTYSKADEQHGGGIKVLRSNNISFESNTINFLNVKSLRSDVKVSARQKLSAGDILISAASGSRAHVGKVAYIAEDIDYFFGGFMAVLRCSDRLVGRYLFHWLTSNEFRDYLDSAIESTTINNLNSGIVGRFKIPVPEKPVQHEIAAILDTLSEIVTDTRSGLPAEITARRQQYEYYRNKLLTFKELKAS